MASTFVAEDARCHSLVRSGRGFVRAQDPSRSSYTVNRSSSGTSASGQKRPRLCHRNTGDQAFIPALEDTINAPNDLLDCMVAAQQGVVTSDVVVETTGAIASVMAAGLQGIDRRNRLSVDPSKRSKRVKLDVKPSPLAVVQTLDLMMGELIQGCLTKWLSLVEAAAASLSHSAINLYIAGMLSTTTAWVAASRGTPGSADACFEYWRDFGIRATQALRLAPYGDALPQPERFWNGERHTESQLTMARHGFCVTRNRLIRFFCPFLEKNVTGALSAEMLRYAARHAANTLGAVEAYVSTYDGRMAMFAAPSDVEVGLSIYASPDDHEDREEGVDPGGCGVDSDDGKSLSGDGDHSPTSDDGETNNTNDTTCAGEDSSEEPHPKRVALAAVTLPDQPDRSISENDDHSEHGTSRSACSSCSSHPPGFVPPLLNIGTHKQKGPVVTMEDLSPFSNLNAWLDRLCHISPNTVPGMTNVPHTLISDAKHAQVELERALTNYGAGATVGSPCVPVSGEVVVKVCVGVLGLKTTDPIFKAFAPGARRTLCELRLVSNIGDKYKMIRSNMRTGAIIERNCPGSKGSATSALRRWWSKCATHPGFGGARGQYNANTVLGDALLEQEWTKLIKKLRTAIHWNERFKASIDEYEAQGKEPPDQLMQAYASVSTELCTLTDDRSIRLQRVGLAITVPLAIAHHTLYGDAPITLAFPLPGNGPSDPRNVFKASSQVASQLAVK